jgi:protein-tyrosine phosphatase
MSSEIRFPDGTVVRACGVASRNENAAWREFGLYLDTSWRPEWPAVVLDWPDFSVPSSRDEADHHILNSFELARQGKKVEIGCLGGIGRTGTVLACMAVLAGVPADEAVGWVRSNYSPNAVEEPKQEEWVRGFAARRRDMTE